MEFNFDGSFFIRGFTSDALIGETTGGSTSELTDGLEAAIEASSPDPDNPDTLDDFLVVRGLTANFTDFDTAGSIPSSGTITNIYSYGLRKIYNLG